MEARVVKAYTDRIDMSVHIAGEVVELDEQRAEELSARGFVAVESQPETEPESEPQPEPETEPEPQPVPEPEKRKPAGRRPPAKKG